MDLLPVADHVAHVRISLGSEEEDDWRSIQQRQAVAVASEWAYLADLRAAAGSETGAAVPVAAPESSLRG